MGTKEIFDDEEAEKIAKEFGDVLKRLGEAFAKLAEVGIAHESRFSPKEGTLTIRLFREVEDQF